MKLKKIIASICAVSVFVLSAVSVSAAENLTPSVTKKDSVTVTQAVDNNGNSVEIIVTPYSRFDDIPTQDYKDQMKEAYDEISSVDSLDKLNFQGTNPFIGKEDYVVANLFDVYASDSSVFDNGGSVTVTFNVSDVNDDVDTVWIHRDSETEKWENVDATRTASHTYEATFTSLSPVAIAVPRSAAGTITSPQTGDTTSYMLYILTISGVAVFASVAVFAGKKFVTAE